MEFIANLGQSILANLVFWLSSGFAGYAAIRLTESQFVSLFGVRDSRRLTVYLSNLWDRKSDAPYTPIVSGHEFRVSKTITGLFGDAPLRMPDLAKGLVDTVFAGDRVDVTFEVSPLVPEEIRFSNMISVGASTKNSVRRHYLAAGLPYLAFVGETTEPVESIFRSPVEQRVRIMKGPLMGETIEGDYNFAIVEKAWDAKLGVAVIMCAGVRADGSWAATEYLARNWRKLARRFGDSCFAICLGFPKLAAYMDSYLEPMLVRQIPALDSVTSGAAGPLA